MKYDLVKCVSPGGKILYECKWVPWVPKERWKPDPALYSARCERIRRRKQARLDRFVDRLFTCAVVVFAWAVSVALILAWW